MLLHQICALACSCGHALLLPRVVIVVVAVIVVVVIVVVVVVFARDQGRLVNSVCQMFRRLWGPLVMRDVVGDPLVEVLGVGLDPLDEGGAVRSPGTVGR